MFKSVSQGDTFKLHVLPEQQYIRFSITFNRKKAALLPDK